MFKIRWRLKKQVSGITHNIKIIIFATIGPLNNLTPKFQINLNHFLHCNLNVDKQLLEMFLSIHIHFEVSRQLPASA